MELGKMKDKIFYSFKEWNNADFQLDDGLEINVSDSYAFVLVRITGARFCCTLTKTGVKKNSWRIDRT